MNGSVTCTRRQYEETDCDLNPIGTCTNNKNSNRSSGKHTTENPDATRAEPLITKHRLLQGARTEPTTVDGKLRAQDAELQQLQQGLMDVVAQARCAATTTA